MERFSEYRIMWLLVFFDLPTETAKERKAHANFRKALIQDGFVMFQFSIYIRHCPSAENAEMHTKRIKAIMPDKGKIGIMRVTDKQFADMEIFESQKEEKVEMPVLQLELF